MESVKQSDYFDTNALLVKTKQVQSVCRDCSYIFLSRDTDCFTDPSNSILNKLLFLIFLLFLAITFIYGHLYRA